MAKWSIRDLWGKRTEKKGLNPGVRDMLTSLDGVYEPRATDSENQQSPDRSLQEDGSQHAVR